MASEADMPEISLRNIHLLLPLLIRLAAARGPDSEDGNRIRELIFIIRWVIQNVGAIEGFENLESLFIDDEAPLPATKASIEAMPTVEVTEEGKECVICLEEFEVGGEVREMPCKHGFHSGCIEKWLGIHGSCPVCRYRMPVKEEENKSGDRGGGESWVWNLVWRSSDSGLDRAGEFGEIDGIGNGEVDDGSSAMDWTPEIGETDGNAEVDDGYSAMDWTPELENNC